MSEPASDSGNLLKIGEFARLTQVTNKALHHYDKIGLLQPEHIDPLTGYRYYTIGQLPRIHRIMALRDLGLSLKQIAIMVDEEVSTEQIWGMLALKRAEALQEMQEARQRLAMIEFRLHMIEAENEFPELDVLVKPLDAMRFLSMFVPPFASLEAALRHMRATAQAIRQAIADGTIKHTGVSIDVLHGDMIVPFDHPELREWQHEVLLGVTDEQEPVTLPGIGRWTIKEEPAVPTAVSLMLTGPQNGTEQLEKVTLLRRWAIAQGYQPSGLVRYFNHRGPLQTNNVDEFVAEAQMAVEKRPEGSAAA